MLIGFFIELFQDIVTCFFDVSSFKVQMRWQKDPESVLTDSLLNDSKKKYIYSWKFLACCLITYILIEAAKKSEKMKFSQNKITYQKILVDVID